MGSGNDGSTRAGRGRGRETPYSKKKFPKKTGGTPPAAALVDKKICYWCAGYGHTKANCFRKKQGAPTTIPPLPEGGDWLKHVKEQAEIAAKARK